MKTIKNDRFVVSISFANYLKDKSGVPKVMMEHQLMYNKKRITYISLFSVKKNICNDRIMLFCKFGLIIDGEYMGVYQMSQIINYFVDLCNIGKRIMDIHIHHLMYMNIELVSDLLDCFFDVPVKVYLHDYYNVCSNYNLMNKNGEYCGARGLDKIYCGSCPSYRNSVKIQERIHTFFTKHLERICFICPSTTTKNIFLSFHPEYEKITIIIPHQVFYKRYNENLECITPNERIKVAYLGMPATHKGWKTWNKIISMSENKYYDFIVLNSTNDSYDKMKKVKISFSKDNLNAMVDSLRCLKVHVVVLWSLCQETYSYTCFEGFSANAMIITGKVSGNIADTVKKYNCGYVLDSEEELIELFRDADKMRNIINDFRMNTIGGPKELYANEYIVELTEKRSVNSSNIAYRKNRKIVSNVLLWLLNKAYK